MPFIPNTDADRTAMLERIGYRVILAEDGRQALEAFQAHQADIAGVLLDLTQQVGIAILDGTGGLVVALVTVHH